MSLTFRLLRWKFPATVEGVCSIDMTWNSAKRMTVIGGVSGRRVTVGDPSVTLDSTERKSFLLLKVVWMDGWRWNSFPGD